MKNQELFDKTVAILVKAYLNNTLKRGVCYSCAVGNMVAAAMGYQFDSEKRWIGHENLMYHEAPPLDTHSNVWASVICTTSSGQRISLENFKGIAKKQIESTGYTLFEIAMIEKQFEHAGSKFKGLMAVVDVLIAIHEATPEQARAAKELFVKC